MPTPASIDLRAAAEGSVVIVESDGRTEPPLP
jgi:hypothetical protein